MTRVGVVGLNYWGPNLVRNFDDLADLTWLCDLDERAPRERSRSRFPNARATTDLDDLLADDELDAVVIATPVPTHYALAKRALEAGKHVFVEKPPAMRAAEIDELVAIAAERDLVLMPGHLLLYHPGVLKLKELVDAGELGDVLCVYGNRVNLGIVRTNENALWSLGVHDLSRDPLPPRRGSGARDRARQLRRSTKASKTSSSASCASRAARSRTCTSPGSTRTRCGR